MNVLITGGTGVIGQAFIREFKQYRFTVLTRSSEKAKAKLPGSVSFIECLSMLKNLDNFDIVINLAGEPIIDKRWSKKQKKVICESRWSITSELVKLLANSEQPPSVFLSGSAIGVYGDRGDNDITELSTVQESDFPTHLCLKWENIAQQAAAYTRVVTLRTGIVLTADGGALAKMLFPFKCCLGGRIGDGQQYMSWIHYLDQIHAMNYLINNEKIEGAVNLVAPNPQKNLDFTKALSAAVKRPAIIPVPVFVLKSLLGESSSLLLDSQKVLPQVLLNKGYEFQYSDLSTALDHLVSNPQTPGIHK